MHLENDNTYVRMLFIDYSSAFNTTIPSRLVIKLSSLGFPPDLCNLMLDFLSKDGDGVHPLRSPNPEHQLLYREEVENLVQWCQGNQPVTKCGKNKGAGLQEVGKS